MEKFKIVLILEPDGNEVVDGEYTAEEALAKIGEIEGEGRTDILAAVMVDVSMVDKVRTLN